ncbi:DUF58 domain-containing protein [Anaerolineales bacterium HSG25]|nr:DUF58 domain-containing protein [Anaerolineales bacterium HSG25]
MRNIVENLERNWVLGLICLASLIAALAFGEPLFFTLTYLFAGILVISFIWAWLNVHWIRVSRKVKSHYVQVGNFFEERVTLHNTGPLPKLWVELKDWSNLPNHRASRVVSRLGRRQQRNWHIRTPCYQRGRYTLGPISILSSDPFFNFIFTKDLPENFTSTVIVFPLAVDLPNFQPAVGELTGGLVIDRRTHYTTTNVSGVREYVSGDSFNRIHWRSTARNGRLMVKEFELDPVADIWIFVDMGRMVQVGPSFDEIQVPELPKVHWEKLPDFTLAPSTEEYGVTIAASLSRHFLRQGRAVGLITYPEGQHREIAQTDRGERQLTRIYEILAVTQAHGSIPIAELLALEGARLSRNTTAIVITPSLDPKWVAALRHLNDRGIRSTAIVIDPSSFGVPNSSKEVEVELTSNRIPYYVVNEGDDLGMVLSNRR